ncbi:MAG: hypothetical protein GWN81_07780 [Phycisphaerae bacterium]|nr:hypothetical protein [Phycisphaerae bacterium]NIW50191.1 hypothetical protein [Gammaproteobacteria bacterium]
MNRLLVVILLLFLPLCFTQTARAEYFSGILLNKYCHSESSYEKGMCLGYIVGVVDSFNTTYALRGEKRVFCIPPGVTSGQLVLVLKKSMQEHPETLHLPASAHTLSALTAAFPCGE